MPAVPGECVEREFEKAMREILVVIPYLASASQGNELELAVTGWRKHFKEPFHIVVVGDHHPVVETGDDISFIDCPRIDPVPGQYTPHLDHVHKFRKVREAYPDTDGFIYTCDDIYATADFDLVDVKIPKYPEIATKWLEDRDWHRNDSDWYADRGKTADLCRREGLHVLDWVCHLPVYYEWDKLLAIYDKYDCDHVSYIVENIYFNQGTKQVPIAFDARDYRDEVRTSYPGNLRPVGSVMWITNANCGWSETLENILKEHYGLA